LGHRRQDLGTL